MNKLITCDGCQRLSIICGGITGKIPIKLCGECWIEVRKLATTIPESSAFYKFKIMIRKKKLAKLLS